MTTTAAAAILVTCSKASGPGRLAAAAQHTDSVSRGGRFVSFSSVSPTASRTAACSLPAEDVT